MNDSVSPASMVEQVTKAIHAAMDITDGLDSTAAQTYARAAIEAVRQALINETKSMQFSEDRDAMFCAAETLEDALKHDE